MEDRKFNFPLIGNKYILRSTLEEVEVVAFEQPSNGLRGDDDWVTYIDSNGSEHIREKLNFQLDFKASDEFSKMFLKIMDPSNLNIQQSQDNVRIFEVAKDLLVNKCFLVEDAIYTAKRFLEVFKKEVEGLNSSDSE